MEYVIQFVNASLNLPDFQFAFRYERLLKGSRSCCRPVNIPNQIETFSSLAESSLPDRTLLKKLNLFWRRASCVPNQRRGRDVSWIASQCGTSLQIGIFCAMPIVVHLPRQPRLLSRYLVFQLLRRYLLSPLEGKYSSRKFLRYPLLCRAILSKWMSSQGSGAEVCWPTFSDVVAGTDAAHSWISFPERSIIRLVLSVRLALFDAREVSEVSDKP